VKADEEYEGNVYYKQRHDVASQDVAERRGDRLGEYVQADEEYEGRVYNKQRDSVARGGDHIYKAGGRWYASKTLGGPVGLRSQETGDLLPPTQNWEYWGDGKWTNDDASLTLTFASLPTPCPIVRVAGEGDVVEKQGSSLGDYRLEKGLWSSGRPVFKKEDGGIERVLFVGEGTTDWSIRTSTSSSGGWMKSGRATVSPTMPEAGPSEKLNRAGWVYSSDGWKEGTISVTCIE